MNIKIEPRKTTDRGGYLMLPLIKNIPYPANDTWKKSTCPKCGSECWDRQLPPGFTEDMFSGKMCTECALRMTVQEKAEMTTARAKTLIANMADVIRKARQDIYNREFAEFLMKETGITAEELAECGIMEKEAIIDD
jgi:hypothetical protein